MSVLVFLGTLNFLSERVREIDLLSCMSSLFIGFNHDDQCTELITCVLDQIETETVQFMQIVPWLGLKLPSMQQLLDEMTMETAL